MAHIPQRSVVHSCYRMMVMLDIGCPGKESGGRHNSEDVRRFSLCWRYKHACPLGRYFDSFCSHIGGNVEEI
jgi:hypothetical protein